MKFIFITGGVVSSVGKGLFAGALGALLESSGLKCTCMKLDPYVNVDPGTMRPSEHGEVYVTHDGIETDLDLGHYERFLSTEIGGNHYATTGQIYSEVIRKERQGDYLGACVQVVPHITNHIQSLIEKVGHKHDITLVEVGGTVGDIESLPFLEAIRQLRIRYGAHQVVFVHVTWLPYIESAGELKTKPTQHSVKELRSIGIQPDILVCRSKSSINITQKEKIALFTNVPIEAVISTPDLESIYAMPSVLAAQKVDKLIQSQMNIEEYKIDISRWETLIKPALNNKNKPLKIAIIGKYVSCKDAYKSLDEALKHASMAIDYPIVLEHVSASSESLTANMLSTYNGIIVPGGFGSRGVEGKLLAIQYAREHQVPFLGICYGMQLAVIEFCRHVLGLKGANSSEIDSNTPHPVVGIIEELCQRKSAKQAIHSKMMLGGTMRLGAITDTVKKGSLLSQVYQAETLRERHRHRYEVNPEYCREMAANGMIVSGLSEREGFIDVIEIKEHPWFMGCQFHPEFTSKPLEPSKLFVSFLNAAKKRQEIAS